MSPPDPKWRITPPLPIDPGLRRAPPRPVLWFIAGAVSMLGVLAIVGVLP